MKNENLYIIDTEDGTSTLFHKDYDQAMHSTSGAFEESLLKHVFPSDVLNLKKDKIYILDIGFGMGYNVLALIDEYEKRKCNSVIKIISLEKEQCFLEYINQVHFGDGRDGLYTMIKNAYKSSRVSDKEISLQIIFGDARKSLSLIEDYKFDAVFQDPFSPSKNPELWSVEYFRKIKNLMNEEGILTTYSSADQIRRAMLEAGLTIGKGPSVGKKREGTIASPSKNRINPVADETIEEIMNNIRSVPYRDTDLNETRENILERRLGEIREIKNSTKEYHQVHQG